MAVVHWTADADVAVLAVDYPPVNALSAAVRGELGEALARARDDDAIRAVVILGAGRTFIAGADITEFGTERSGVKPSLHDLQDMLEKFPKLTVAAIHGTALGGGLELALTTHARVAVADAEVGLPEVNLGLLPGAGGTQRLPRLIGIEAALDLITSGRHVAAPDALRLGIVDAIVDDARAGAIAFAREALAAGTRFEPVIARDARVTGIDPGVFEAFRAGLARKARGRLAPFAIVDCMERATQSDAATGLAYERERFLTLQAGDQHAALKHYFFAEREARKVPGIGAEVQARPIRSAAVIGAGTMGGGIAMVFANAGIPVTLLDVDAAAVARGLAAVSGNYDISVGRGSMSAERRDRALALLRTTTDYADIADADIVVEAVFEKMALKKTLFAQLDAAMKPGAILATNTSSLDIDEIAAATGRPEDVIGVHFFSPANVMKLQENVRGRRSAPAVIKTVMEFGKRLGKMVVLAGNCDGFIGNRMLQYYTGEAEFLLEQGATPEQIDRVAMAFGMPMGPISMRDMSGLDIGVAVRAERAKSLPAGERMSPIVERLAERGRLGMKAGKGFYRYEGREKFPDPETIEVIEGVARDHGIVRRAFADDELELRLFAPLVNEGAKELEDGTALRAGDIDVAWVNGYGFPAHKGGPMFWGARIGLDRIHALAVEAEKRNGPRWAPSPLLARLAREGKGWRDA